MSNNIEVACQQFNIKGASEQIMAVRNLPEVFSPPHHGPRNIPIVVKLTEDAAYSYTHFPIVRSGVYAIYLDTSGVFDGLVYNGTNQDTGTGVEITTVPTSVDQCPQFKDGFASATQIVFNQNDPQPIAIRFKNGDHKGATISYIVTLVP